MNDVPESTAEGNPFSTRHVRPGAIPYLFPPGESCDTLLARLEHVGWRGQIVGPHGSGKSALLATLRAELEARKVAIEGFELHDGQRALPGGVGRLAGLPRGTLVIVDGYEQLAFWKKVFLRRCCRCRGLGLLVTAHAPVGLPTLFSTSTSLALAERIVEYLLDARSAPVSGEEFQRRFARHQGNLRELLFDLYDAYEQRRGRGGVTT